jgi:transposase InsO family protein
LTEEGVREYVGAMRERYQKGSRAEKSRLLDEFCAVTGHHRKAAIRALNRTPGEPGRRRQGRPRRYDVALVPYLVQVWDASGGVCSKRLAPFLPELITQLRRHGEVTIPEPIAEQLLQLSPASIDRLLAPERRRRPRPPVRQAPAPRSIQRLVPIRTFGEWDGVQPGSLQADLVFHSGEQSGGFHLTSLVAVDVATGWIECQPVWGMGKTRVGSAVHHVRQRLPMPLTALHTDNGGEFLNQLLSPWCQREGIALTRGRPYKKNDQAYVEHRNWLAVRRFVGYDRYRSKAAFEQLGTLYTDMRLSLNFFQPMRKLIAKERHGARVTKRYDTAQTPYQRLQHSGVLDAAALQRLQAQYDRLNPVALKQRIDHKLEALWKLAEHQRS